MENKIENKMNKDVKEETVKNTETSDSKSNKRPNNTRNIGPLTTRPFKDALEHFYNNKKNEITTK